MNVDTKSYKSLAVAVLWFAIKDARRGEREAETFITGNSFLLIHWCHLAGFNAEIFREKAKQYLDGIREETT